jgi:ATP-binding cassette subfamily C (CFTR/MRP) protein 4
LIKQLLGEENSNDQIKDQIKIKGKVYYVRQEPWIFNGSIKDNICFGNNYNENKFNRVLKLCCLDQVGYLLVLMFNRSLFLLLSH